MPRSSGTFTAASSSVNPAVEGSTIDEVDFNALIDDIESGLTESTYTSGLGSTDNVVARTDGTDTKKLQGSAVSIDDSGNMSGVAALSATTIELGHASDTTLARSGAGDITIEGNAVYRAGGTDVPVTDGGTGASTAAAGFRALAEGVGSTQGDVLFRDGTQWTVLGAGSAGQVLTSGGAGADVSWSAAGSGDVTAGAVMTDNTIVRGDGGSKGVQDSGVTIDDTDNVAGMATLTLPNTGLHLLDTNASHDLIIAPGSDLTADRTLTIITSDADRTLDLTAGSMAPTTAGLAMVEAASAAAQTALLDAVVGDSGSGGTKGLVPAPAAGDAAASKFLKADGTWTAPAGAGDMAAATYDPATIAEQLVGLTATQTLTNKTLTTPTITLKQGTTPTPTAEGAIEWDTDQDSIIVGDGSSQVTFRPVIDEDDMVSDSAVHVPTQQSVKAYVDASGGGGGGNASYINNLTLAASVAANALTIAVKVADGSTNPSAGDPISVTFRSATASSGGYDTVSIAAALSVTLSSGSTLGASSATPFRGWVVLFNDGGTARLGLVNCRSGRSILSLDETQLLSSTAEGGAGAADSAQVIYTGTAVSAQAFRILGFFDYGSGLTTAGTWDAAPTQLQLFGPGVARPGTPTGNRNQTVKTDTFTSTTSGAYTDITGFAVSITPISACNLVRVVGAWNNIAGASNIAATQVVRGSTPIDIGDSWAGIQATSTIFRTSDAVSANFNGCDFIDAPASASSTTYKVQFYLQGDTYYFNRTSTSTSSPQPRMASTLAVEELMG